MKFKFDNNWNKLSIRIIALFATAMLVSYSPDLLRGFFGDTYIPTDQWGYRMGAGVMDREYDWGYRHYLYFYMCIALFVVQAVRICTWIDENKSGFKA